MNEIKNGEVLTRVQDVFKLAMGDDVQVDMNTEKDMVLEWDSLNHLNLVVELENSFDLGLSMEEIARRLKRIDELRASPRRKRDAAMIRSIFTRDGHPATYDMAVPEAIIAAEMKFGDQIPSGTYIDMAANLPVVDPKKVLCPVLMLRGEHDGNSTNEDLLDFYSQLPNGDRQFIILPHTAHSVGYSRNRHLMYYAVNNFLAAPAPIAA